MRDAQRESSSRGRGILILGSAGCRVAHASRVSGDGVLAIANFPGSLKSVLRFQFSEKIVSASRRNPFALERKSIESSIQDPVSRIVSDARIREKTPKIR
jgi:hypothetical protein